MDRQVQVIDGDPVLDVAVQTIRFLNSPSTSTSATTMANIFLCTSMPAMWYGIDLSSWERRACLVASFRVASYRGSWRERRDAQLFGQSRTLWIKQLLGLACAMANLDLAAPSAILPNLDDFHSV